jgi:hypothetical protein
MCTTTEQVVPVTAADALGMLHSALDYLNSADLHALGVAGQKQALTVLGQVEAKTSVFRSAALAAFDVNGGPEADGCKNAASWLRTRGGHTKAAARAAAKESRQHAAHPAVAAALATGAVTGSIGSLIIGWTNRLPDELQAEGDQILVTAAEAGCGERELNILGARLLEEYLKSRPDPDEDDPHADRSLWLEETFDGAGKLRGDLTPQATAALRAVLDSLGKAKGPEDLRTPGERNHDALQTALEMILGAGGVPQRHGSPTTAEVMTSLDQLRGMDGASALEDAWLHSHTPGAPVFLTGAAAQGGCCDATLIPVVTGCPDWDTVEAIVGLVLAAYRHREADERNGTDAKDRSRALTSAEWDALRYEIAKRCIGFCSGPHGAASMLRQGLFTQQPFGAASLVLDIGFSETIPAHLRKAVILRDRHCAWPGGCDEPPARCDVHHLKPKSRGGETSLGNLGLVCKFHHLIAIHAWGWTLKLLPGGVWEATSPDGQITYRTHDPPEGQAA